LEAKLKDANFYENENRRLAELLMKREREIEELRNRPAPQFDTSAYDQKIAELNTIIRNRDYEIEQLRN
jgi:predicted RNase H-like nuclease (RuvC/YqgF family)